jgi:hypothetical protein
LRTQLVAHADQRRRDEKDAGAERRKAATAEASVERSHAAVVAVRCVSCCFDACDDPTGLRLTRTRKPGRSHEEIEIEGRDGGRT